MSRDKNLWQSLGLAFGAGIQDNQLALPYEWEEFSPPSRASSKQTVQNTFWSATSGNAPRFNLQGRTESVVA